MYLLVARGMASGTMRAKSERPLTTYIEALAPYTQAQQLKLALLVLRKLNH
jgi:hypothetical protein